MQRTNELSESEKGFCEKRSKVAMKALQELLGKRGPSSVEETPTIALVISGGGFRAVSTSCGATEALMEKGIFDALMYSVGLSGSVWYLSSIYSRKSFSSLEQLKKDHDNIRDRLGYTPWSILINVWKSALLFLEHKTVDLVHLYGDAIGDVLLGKELKSIKLSSLKEYVGDAKVPYLIFSAAHVWNHYPLVDFWEEVELTPFEATYASYGLSIPIEHINSVWKNGSLSEARDEPMLHYIMGFCGSAFAILFDHIKNEDEMVDKKLSNPKPNDSDISKEEFEKKVWKPFLEKAFAAKGEDMTIDDAYNIYIECTKSPKHRKWVEDTIRKLEDGVHVGTIPPHEFKDVKTAGMLSWESHGRNSKPFLRTGMLRNPLFGMADSVEKFMLDGQPVRDQRPDATKRISQPASVDQHEILVVDSGLGCNVPAIHVARPQRKVDVMLIIDCEVTRVDKTSTHFLGTLKDLKQQMYDNNMKFPPIDIEKLSEDPEQEYYLFEDAEDPDCPVVIWFNLYNIGFKKLQHANRSDEYPPEKYFGEKFNDFDVTDGRIEYGTLNLSYKPRDVDRLRELMRYNIGTNIEIVKDKIAQKVNHLRTQNSEA